MRRASRPTGRGAGPRAAPPLGRPAPGRDPSRPVVPQDRAGRPSRPAWCARDPRWDDCQPGVRAGLRVRDARAPPASGPGARVLSYATACQDHRRCARHRHGVAETALGAFLPGGLPPVRSATRARADHRAANRDAHVPRWVRGTDGIKHMLGIWSPGLTRGPPCGRTRALKRASHGARGRADRVPGVPTGPARGEPGATWPDTRGPSPARVPLGSAPQ